MSTAVTPPPADKQIEDVVTALDGAIQANVLNSVPSSDPNAVALAKLRGDLVAASAAAAAARKKHNEEVTALNKTQEDWLKSMKAAAEEERRSVLLKTETKDQLREAGLDLVRLAIAAAAFVLGYLGVMRGDAAAARLALWLANGFMVALLVTAALHSNTTYGIVRPLGKRLYFFVMPTRVSVLLLMPLLFAAVWLGFAGEYLVAGISKSINDALFVSLGGFASYASGITSDAGQTLAMLQLSNGILILVCIFALVINRLSDW